MLLTTFVLISVDSEHDGLEQRIDLSHGNESAQVGNVSWLGLEQEEQVAVFLCLFVVGEEAFLQFEAVFEVAGYFVLLHVKLAYEVTGITCCLPLLMPCGSE